MSHPSLSIVICTYNRDSYLKECLAHLSKQHVASEPFEIIVVDNNSVDHTEAVCREFQQSCPQIDFNYFVETQQGLSFSRNLGIKQAKAPLISYLDDDAFADSSYVRNLCQYFQQNKKVDAIGGKITPVYQEQKPPWMSKYLLPLVAALDMGKVALPFRGQKFPIGANMAFRKSVLEDFKGFNTDLGRKGEFLGSGEEKELFFRMKASKKNIHYVPSVHVSHSIPQKRTQEAYIKKMAAGIGKSEALRLKNASWNLRIAKWLQEFFKIGATIILAFYYTLSLKWSKAKMLVKFRFWVLENFAKG